MLVQSLLQASLSSFNPTQLTLSHPVHTMFKQKCIHGCVDLEMRGGRVHCNTEVEESE